MYMYECVHVHACVSKLTSNNIKCTHCGSLVHIAIEINMKICTCTFEDKHMYLTGTCTCWLLPSNQVFIGKLLATGGAVCVIIG